MKTVRLNFKIGCEGSLSLSHEPSLARRIKDLGKPIQETFDWLIGADGSNRARADWREVVASTFLLRLEMRSRTHSRSLVIIPVFATTILLSLPK